MFTKIFFKFSAIQDMQTCYHIVQIYVYIYIYLFIKLHYQKAEKINCINFC